MPYTASSAPSFVRAMPAGASAIWIAAFNAAFAEYKGNEAIAHRVAWAAVKQKYKKSGDNWVEKADGGEERVAVNLNDLSDVLLVPDFVSIVGTVAKQGRGETLDVLIRQQEEDGSLKLRVRNALVGKAADINAIWNPAGPHGTFLPLFDLVLRPKAASKRHILDGSKSPYRFPQEEYATKCLTMEALKASDELKTIWGIVMIPNVLDTQKQTFPQEAIREAMHKFNARTLGKAASAIRLQHGKPIDADIVESYQAPSDVKYGERTVPEGSWVMAIKINDPDVWERVKKGQLTGLSPRIRWREGNTHPVKKRVVENHVQQAI